jgi:NADPH-dependent 2,4-dienoyl-CoA reductase/sulfur reductase-like enzyme
VRRTELAIVGAGCAGLAAAVEAAQAGVEVTVFDEHERAGGQLFKQIHKFFGSRAHLAGVRGHDIAEMLVARCRDLGVAVRLSTTVYGVFPGNVLGLATPRGVGEVQAERLLIATGAKENALAFPGWTLPGVMGAGAAQTLMHLHRVLPGRRVLMVGSGNVGLIVAFQLLQAGAEVAAVVELRDRVGGYHVHADKLRRAGVPILLRHTVRETVGADGVRQAVVCPVDGAGRQVESGARVFDVDCVCLAVGLSPLSELAEMAGCALAWIPELGGTVPAHDEDMRTTVAGIFVAGDVAGVEEANTAIDEGRLAGIAIAESLGRLSAAAARDAKQAIRDRLHALRLGPFGRARAAAKQALSREFGAFAASSASAQEGLTFP